MGRPLRPTSADVVYHVLNRANARRMLFNDDGDYAAFGEETVSGCIHGPSATVGNSEGSVTDRAKGVASRHSLSPERRLSASLSHGNVGPWIQIPRPHLEPCCSPSGFWLRSPFGGVIDESSGRGPAGVVVCGHSPGLDTLASGGGTLCLNLKIVADTFIFTHTPFVL